MDPDGGGVMPAGDGLPMPPGPMNEGAVELTHWMSRWAGRGSLSLVHRHFEAMEQLIQDSGDERGQREDFRRESARRINAKTALLLTCANVEEVLYTTWTRELPDEEMPSRGGIAGFKRMLGKKGFGIALDTASWWEDLVDAFELRNCLLHGNGRVSYQKERRQRRIRTLIARHPDRYGMHRDRLEVLPVGVIRAIGAAAELLDEIYAARLGDLRPLYKRAQGAGQG